MKLSHNTFDQFLAFWNVIEILGKEFHIPTTRTERNAVKNKIYPCFNEYFWKIETRGLPEKWIDSMYDKRNEIVYGGGDNRILLEINLIPHIVIREARCQFGGEASPPHWHRAYFSPLLFRKHLNSI